MLHTIFPPHGATYEQATLLGVVLCLLTALVRYLPNRSVKYAPGPKPLPLLGNIIYFSKMLKNLPVEVPLMAKRFGGTCMMWMGSKPILMIHKLEDAHELLSKRGALTASRPRKNIFMEHVWPKILPFSPAGEEMRFFRRIYTDILGPKQSLQVRKYQDYETIVSLAAFCETPDDYESGFSTSVIFSAVYGARVSRLTHPLMVELQDVWTEILHNAQPGSLIIDWLPFLEKLPLRFQPWVKRADSLHARDCAVHMAFLNLLRRQIEAGIEPVCFGVNAIAHQKQEGFDDDLLLGILTAIIVAGSESTASMMQSFIKIMAMNPEIQQRAQQELDRVVGPSRLPTWEDQPNLPYTRALIKELHRYSPILTFSFPHLSTDEFVYQGYTIPKNTLLLPCADNLTRDRTRYDDVKAFQPERFLGDDLEAHLSARQSDFRKRDHVNYGFGRRMCPGIQVAENSLFIQISRFLWAFDTMPKPGAPPLDMTDTEEQLTRKPKPFKVNIAPRSDAILQVIHQTAKESHTDIPDIDSIKMDG
ncbi:hypothetical protein FP744_10005524 [Trichoderma asperellum]|nr:cytochrome P450 [Trichoderma asperelloides]